MELNGMRFSFCTIVMSLAAQRCTVLWSLLLVWLSVVAVSCVPVTTDEIIAQQDQNLPKSNPVSENATFISPNFDPDHVSNDLFKGSQTNISDAASDNSHQSHILTDIGVGQNATAVNEKQGDAKKDSNSAPDELTKGTSTVASPSVDGQGAQPNSTKLAPSTETAYAQNTSQQQKPMEFHETDQHVKDAVPESIPTLTTDDHNTTTTTVANAGSGAATGAGAGGFTIANITDPSASKANVSANANTAADMTTMQLPPLNPIKQDVDTKIQPFLAMQKDHVYDARYQRAYGPSPYEARYHALGDDDGEFDVLKHWGPLAPYFSSPMFAELQRERHLPKQCTLKQVHLLHRHGARLANEDNLFVTWFNNVTSDQAARSGAKTTFSGPLKFLSTWGNMLGKNVLTAAGTQQMFDSGVQAHYHYGGLAEGGRVTHKPVMRTVSQRRVHESAQIWAMGYYGTNASDLVDLEVQNAGAGFNSTLQATDVCPAASERKGSQMMAQWVDRYLSRAVARLSRYVHGSYVLTPSAVYGMQALCPMETYALGVSNFCELFTRHEWRGFQYAADLMFQGNNGFMSPTGRAQGIGWVQELVARMTNTAIETSFTSQNSTLDNNRTTFPLDQTFFADFTHGGQMVSVLTALNFTAFATQLSSHFMDESRNFITSHVIPFAARFYVEVLECNEEDVPSSGDAHKHYVRFFLNDALLPVSHEQGCIRHHGKHDGLCELGKFVEHVNKVAVPAADFANVCFRTSDKNATSLTTSSSPSPSTNVVA